MWVPDLARDFEGVEVFRNGVASAQTPNGPALEGSEVRIHILTGQDTYRVQEAIRVLNNSGIGPTQSARLEAIRDLAGTHDPAAVAALQAEARRITAPSQYRAEAVLALTGSHEDHLSMLTPLLTNAPTEVQVELIRGLRSWTRVPGVKAALEPFAQGTGAVAEHARLALGRGRPRPADDAGWQAVLSAGPGEVAAGRRVFFSPGASCGKCHRIEGRGGLVGPDLSLVARGLDQERLRHSLVEPSLEVAPQFTQHLVETVGGEVFGGRVWAEPLEGSLVLINGEGTVYTIPLKQIRERRIETMSLMPDGLLEGLTDQDFRDLMAFLESRK